MDFILFVNEIKAELEQSLLNLEKLKKEHEENGKARRYQNESEYQTLSDIIIPTLIKVSMLKGFKGMADEEPASSPNIPLL
ncbi:hypothetical protein PS15m_011924 [Mucor circinelloides]